jgi:hypothetical protein
LKKRGYRVLIHEGSLQERTEGNARNVETNEIAGRIGRVALAASNVVLALAVDEVGDADEDIDIELGALVKETKTLGTVLSSEKIGKSTGKRTGGNLNLITSEGGVVAASDLVVVTAGSLGFLNGYVVADGPEGLLAGILGGALGRRRSNVGKSDCGSSDGKKSDSELHFEGWLVGNERMFVRRLLVKSNECLSGRLLGFRSEGLRECDCVLMKKMNESRR